MGYTNTGYQRATTLTIQVKLNGVVQSTNVFPFKESFTYNSVTYPALTTVQIQQMTNNDYANRATAYAAYVQVNYQSQYPGLTVSETGARVYNNVSCPIT